MHDNPHQEIKHDDLALKRQVRDYWNQQPCGTQFSDNIRYSKDYFDDIEQYRYLIEPYIFSFAQFTRFYGKRILEVGVGAGTDFLQWVRAGAFAYGLDATPEGVTHVQRRLALYGLTAEEIRVADCESLPYDSNFFDLVYSWGVIHHTPNTAKAFHEIIRVCKPGGFGKVMIYHRRSLLAFFFWFKWALLAGKPWKSISWVLHHHMESIGTKAYTKNEVKMMLMGQPIRDVRVRTVLTYYDRLERFGPIHRAVARVLAKLLGGDKVGWFLVVEFTKCE